MRVLGVDYGLKRIGVAIGETDVKMAFARQAVSAQGAPAKDAKTVSEYARKELCQMIVIGLPLHLSGGDSKQAKITKEFGDELEKTGMKVSYWDERYTTSQAELNLGYMDKRKRKQFADSEAARIILQEFLDNYDEETNI